jgi:hypothetical protein
MKDPLPPTPRRLAAGPCRGPFQYVARLAVGAMGSFIITGGSRPGHLLVGRRRA